MTDTSFELLEGNIKLKHTTDAVSGRYGKSTVVRQAARGNFPMLDIASPILAIIRQGQKRVRTRDGETFVVNAGEAIALSGGLVVDVTNTPGDSGVFLADLLVFADDVFESCPNGPRNAPPCHVIPASAPFEECFMRCARAVEDGSTVPQQIVKHRFQELLMWLNANGIVLENGPQNLEVKLRKIVSADASSKWDVSHVLKKLGEEGRAMSSATLRRRLAEAGTSIRSITVEVRLAHALFLLQTSQMAISRIAAESGYASPSRFAQRFKARFGISPSALRNGTELDMA